MGGLESAIGETPLTPEKALEIFLNARLYDNVPFGDVVNEVKTSVLDKVLIQTYGNQAKAARIMGLNRTTIRKMLGNNHGS